MASKTTIASGGFDRNQSELIALQAFLFIMDEFVGNISLACIVLHEKYGMDPQKRTLSNQLMSSVCRLLVIFNFTIMPVWFTYRMYQFDNLAFKIVMVYGVTAIVFFTAFVLAEMVLVRLAFIFYFSKTMVIDENFAFIVLTIFNSMLTSMVLGIRLHLGEYESNPHIAEVNDEFKHDLHKNVNFFTSWLPFFICLLIITIGLPIIYFKKKGARKPLIPLNNIQMPIKVPRTRYFNRNVAEHDHHFEEVKYNEEQEYEQPRIGIDRSWNRENCGQNVYDEVELKAVSRPFNIQVHVEHHHPVQEVPMTAVKSIHVKPYEELNETQRDDIKPCQTFEQFDDIVVIHAEVINIVPGSHPTTKSPVFTEADQVDLDSKEFQSYQKPPVFNTRRLNENLFSNLSIALFCGFFMVTIVPQVFFLHLGAEMNYDKSNMFMFIMCTVTITLLPSLFFVKRPRKFFEALEHFGIYFN